MKKKQTNYLEEATNRFIQELRSKGIKNVQTLETIDNGKSKITFVPRIQGGKEKFPYIQIFLLKQCFGKNLKRMTPSSKLDL